MAYQISHSNIIAAGLLLALSAAVFIASAGFPGGRGGDPGAAFFPRVIVIAIALLAVIQLTISITTDNQYIHEIDPDVVRRLVVVTSFPILYVFIMPAVGFPLTTAVFLSVFMWYSGAQSVPIVIGSSVGVTLVLYYVFGIFFRVPLPEGIVPIGRILPSLIGGMI